MMGGVNDANSKRRTSESSARSPRKARACQSLRASMVPSPAAGSVSSTSSASGPIAHARTTKASGRVNGSPAAMSRIAPSRAARRPWRVPSARTVHPAGACDWTHGKMRSNAG